MSTSMLGRLNPVDPREVWASEAGDFTPWLVEEENLVLLGDTIGLELELESTERNVGPFRADILCKDTVTDSWVLIENQLERTDHSHLGQLLTYAAGLNAVTIVWIARHFTDEHRAALDWLNDITGENINFFGLEIEFWRIGDSAIAPKFNVSSEPNDWKKTVKSGSQQPSGELTDLQRLQQEYWQALINYLEEHKAPDSPLRPRKKARPIREHQFPAGISEYMFYALADLGGGSRVGVQFAVNKGKEYFYALVEQKDAIEGEIGASLEWYDNPNKKRCTISLFNYDTDPTERAQWPEQHTWFIKNLEAFHRTFAPRAKHLRLDN